jgi:tetratricopeptide (TPR) repeat protein
MMSKRELTDTAKGLVKTEPPKAFALYKQAWEEYCEHFNNWDAFFLFQSLRNSGSTDLNIENEILEKFRGDEKVTGMYSWILFDRHVKHFDATNISEFEPGILRLTEIAKQKDLVNSTDGIPCPYTIGVIKMLKAYKKPNFNIQKVGFWLDKLDDNKLSRKPNKYFDDQRKQEVEMASDYESFLSIKAKYLERNEDFDECISVCDRALAEIENMHHDNQIWFKRLKALSLISSGKSDEGEQLLESLLQDRKGQKWFIKKELAEVFNENSDYEKALNFAIDAAMTGEDYSLKTDLYLLIARIFFRLGKVDEASNHAKLLLAITQQEERRDKLEHEKIYQHFSLDLGSKLDVNEWLQKCKKNWEMHQFGSLAKEEGMIERVHENGKSGFIKSTEGKRRFFSMREFVNRTRSDSKLDGYKVVYYLKTALNNRGEEDFHATHIEIIERPSIEKSIRVGDVFDGTIDGITSFGLFIKFHGSKGLLHRKNLPTSKTETLEEKYHKGDAIRIRIKARTDKGWDLDEA